MEQTIRTLGYLRPHSWDTQEETIGRRETLTATCGQVRVEESADPKAARKVLADVMEDLYQAAANGELVLLVVDDLADLGRSMPHVVSHLRQIMGLGHVLILAQVPVWRGVWDPRHARVPEGLSLPDMLDAAALVTALDVARAAMASERVRRGQARARASGTAFGRPPALDETQRAAAAERVTAGEDPQEVARDLGVSRSTVMRVWRVRTGHDTGENTTRGKATPHEPAPQAAQP